MTRLEDYNNILLKNALFLLSRTGETVSCDKTRFWRKVCKSKEKCFLLLYFFGKPQFSFNKNTMNSGMLRHERIFWKAVWKYNKVWLVFTYTCYLGAILGEIGTCWPRIHHIWFSAFSTKLLPTFPDRFKIYSSISEDPLESYPSYFYSKVVLQFDGIKNTSVSINNLYVVPYYFYCKGGSTLVYNTFL